MKMTRKVQSAPPFPDDPVERLEEIKKFRVLLVDRFHDYDYHDVYDSVFRSRVDLIMKSVKLNVDDMDEEEKQSLSDKQKSLSVKIYKFGRAIQINNSTKVKDFIQFFMMIEEFFN